MRGFAGHGSQSPAEQAVRRGFERRVSLQLELINADKFPSSVITAQAPAWMARHGRLREGARGFRRPSSL
jgi:hypothetical protein